MRNISGLFTVIIAFSRITHKVFLNKGKLYVEELTASNIMYAIYLLKNHCIEVLKHKIANVGENDGTVKPLFSMGEGKKRVHGEMTRSKEDIKKRPRSIVREHS